MPAYRTMKRMLIWLPFVAAIAVAFLCLIFRPNGDIGAFLQHPATAAWVQAVGSIVAILAAIWIDNGNARRLTLKEDRSQREHIRSWTKVSIDALETLRETHAAVEEGVTDMSAWIRLGREITNQKILVAMFLRELPPSPSTGLLLVSLSTCLDSVAWALNEFANKQGSPDEHRSLIETSWQAGEAVWDDFKVGRLDSSKRTHQLTTAA